MIKKRCTFKKCQTAKSPRSTGWEGGIVPDQLSVVWYKRLNCLRHGSARYRLLRPRQSQGREKYAATFAQGMPES